MRARGPDLLAVHHPFVAVLHGMPGSRRFRLDAGALDTVGARLITVDRPGFGQSEPQPGRTLLDWPNDVAGLLDELGIERVALIGCSAGGVFALACASAIPDRLTALTLMCPVGPYHDVAALDALHPPYILRLVEAGRAGAENLPWVTATTAAKQVQAFRADPEAYIDASARPADRRWLADPDVRAMVRDDLEEAFRQGEDATAHESVLLFARPWGFRVEDISVDTLCWVGDADRLRAVSEYYASVMPSCTVEVLPDEGHLIGPPHHEPILRAALTPRPR
jgi:pimeloyl-ACP methyl ester carboxylesterase